MSAGALLDEHDPECSVSRVHVTVVRSLRSTAPVAEWRSTPVYQMTYQGAASARETRADPNHRPGRPAAAAPKRRVMIKASRGFRGIDARELWAYRWLILTLAARHIQVRYAQTLLGIGWTILQPVISVAIFTVIFARFARIPSDGKPYQVFALAALVPWTYVSTAVSAASASLSASSAMVTKVYFPRLALPLSYILSSLIDFVIAFVLLLVMMFWFGITPLPASVAVIPPLVIAMALAATGVSCFLAAFDVQYRDVRHVVPFLLQVWMYASPIVYPMSLVPESYRRLYALNPMAGIVEGFRAVLLGTAAVDWRTLGVSVAVSVALCAIGLGVFRHRERIFADVV
jgi:lipopolysaccharide transport system permease protein